MNTETKKIFDTLYEVAKIAHPELTYEDTITEYEAAADELELEGYVDADLLLFNELLDKASRICRMLEPILKK